MPPDGFEPAIPARKGRRPTSQAARPLGSACFLLSVQSSFDPNVWHLTVWSDTKPIWLKKILYSLAVSSVYQTTSCVDCVQQGTLVSHNWLNTKSKIQPVFPPQPQNNEAPFSGTDCDTLALISDVILFSQRPTAVQSTNCSALRSEESYLDSDWRFFSLGAGQFYIGQTGRKINWLLREKEQHSALRRFALSSDFQERKTNVIRT